VALCSVCHHSIGIADISSGFCSQGVLRNEPAIDVLQGRGKDTENVRLGAIGSVIRSAPVAGLCYDTPAFEAMPLLIGIPDTLLRALSSGFYQDKFPSQSLGERLRGNICLLEACIQESRPLKPLLDVFSFGSVHALQASGQKGHRYREQPRTARSSNSNN